MSDQIRDVLTSGLRYEHVQHTDCRGTCTHVTELACTANHLTERLEGWRPPVQVISSADDLEALPDMSIVVIPNRLAVQRWTGDGQAVWIGASDSLVRITSHRLISIWREVTLLHVPTEKAKPHRMTTEPELNALLGDLPIHACVLPDAIDRPRGVPVECSCGRQWVRGSIGWRPVEKATE